MQISRMLSTLAMAALSSMAVATQAQPTFAGRWATDAAPADMGSGWGTTITITHDAAALSVTYAFFGRGDMQPPLKFTYTLDGSESVNAVWMGRGQQQERSRVAWDGPALVITTTYAFVDPATGKPAPAVVTRRLTLDESGALVVDTTRMGVLGGKDVKAKTIYRRTGGT